MADTATKSAKLVQLPIEGMTCASCATRVQKGLGKVPGVETANVNLAAEKAAVQYDPDEVSIDELIGTVRDLGYDVGMDTLALQVGGMTCASCVKRVEKALQQTPGVVSANVNFASEKATIEYLPGAVMPADLKRSITDAGYQIVEEEATEDATVDKREEAHRRHLRTLKIKMGASLGVGALLMLLAYFPPSFLSMREMWFLMFALATPVLFWAGAQFYRGAWAAFRHRAADMNTLIAVGTGTAFLYSVAATVAPGWFAAGGRRRDARPRLLRGRRR